MSSINAMISRIGSRDTAVYWPVDDTTLLGDGSRAYTTPLTIQVIWREDQRIIKDFYEKEFLSRATVYTTRSALDIQGMLYHGSIDDVPSEAQVDPRLFAEAYEIRRIMVVPSFAIKDNSMRKHYI